MRIFALDINLTIKLIFDCNGKILIKTSHQGFGILTQILMRNWKETLTSIQTTYEYDHRWKRENIGLPKRLNFVCAIFISSRGRAKLFIYRKRSCKCGEHHLSEATTALKILWKEAFFFRFLAFFFVTFFSFSRCILQKRISLRESIRLFVRPSVRQ